MNDENAPPDLLPCNLPPALPQSRLGESDLPVAHHPKNRTGTKKLGRPRTSKLSQGDGEVSTPVQANWRHVNLNTLATLLDAHRTSVRRWLTEAGIQPVALGTGIKGAIRFRWSEVHAWLESRAHVR